MKKEFVFKPSVCMMALTAMMLMSCGARMSSSFASNGKVVTEIRNLKDFETVEVNGSPTVYYTQSDSFSVNVRGPEKLIGNIETKVVGNTLMIRNKGKMGFVNIMQDDENEVVVLVSSPDLVNVRLNGSGDFNSKERIDTDQMTVELRGSGDIHLNNVICDQCNISLVGSGDVDMDYLDAKNVTASLTGSGDIDLNLYRVMNTQLIVKGSGDIKASFSKGCKRVDCNAYGSGDITLSGEIEHFSKQISGSAEVDSHKLNIQK